MLNAKELIKKRRSVRTFDKRPVSEEDLKKLEEYMKNVKNPFGIHIEFKILSVSEDGVSSPVIVGEEKYIAAKVKKQPNFEIAYGYSFEMVCLYALSLGIGTVILAASLKRGKFEEAMDLQQDEIMPAASPIGYPASKLSVRESMMRKALGADKRQDFSSVYFSGDFSSGLSEKDAGEFKDALKAAGLAPSAANKQPWRAAVSGDTVHFYEYRTIGDNPLGDIQKVDVGIALAHFDAVMEEEGKKGEFFFEDPKIKTPKNCVYIVSYKLK